MFKKLEIDDGNVYSKNGPDGPVWDRYGIEWVKTGSRWRKASKKYGEYKWTYLLNNRGPLRDYYHPQPKR